MVNVIHEAVIECQIWKSCTLCEAKPLGTILESNVTVFRKFFKTLILRWNSKTAETSFCNWKVGVGVKFD